VTEAEVRSAADAVGGTPIGRLSATTWQLGVEPRTTWDELAAVLDQLGAQPGVVDATPVGVGGLDGDG
jgi:hypothetical protein